MSRFVDLLWRQHPIIAQLQIAIPPFGSVSFGKKPSLPQIDQAPTAPTIAAKPLFFVLVLVNVLELLWWKSGCRYVPNTAFLD